MITTFNIDGLMSILSKELPGIGVKKCYISLYENPSNSIEEARLILAFDENGIINIETGGRLFKSKKLVPDDILENDKIGEMLVLPLYFQEDQIGFALFSTGIPEIRLYETLRAQISSALKGARLVEKINKHSQVLSQGIESLATALEEITRNIESISRNMVQQAGAVSESVSSIEEMAGSIDIITGKTSLANELSNNLSNSADEGKDSVKKAMQSTNEVQKNSQKILNLLLLIKDIAEKTHILSINANIQAAHTGESGKGFTVVANEISKLSDDTNRNIKSIEDEVRSIVRSIDNSVKMTEKTVEGLDKIFDYSLQNTDFIAELNAAMIEQDKGTKDILQASHELLKITEEVRSAIIEQKKATEDFNDSLKRLTDISLEV